MSQSRSTPDERFLSKLLELAEQKGDPYRAMPIKTIATAIGQKETATKNIVKHLAQANFVKKVGDDAVCLTKHGHQCIINGL